MLAKELGIPFSREFNENLKGVSRLDSLKLLLGQADSVAGVEAIKAAGMFAVAIGQRELFPHADLVLADTSRLSCGLLAEAFGSASGH